MLHFTGSHVGEKGGNSTGEYIDISMLFVAFSREFLLSEYTKTVDSVESTL